MKCRNRFFFFFFCEKNIRLNTEGVLTKRTGGSSEHWVFSTVIWAMFFTLESVLYFHVWKLFSPNERRLASWMELGMLQRLMEAPPAFIF